MTQAIWKFETPFEDKFSLHMPAQSEIISVQLDQKTMRACIWAIVFTQNPPEERFFELFGTGQPLYNDMGIQRKYIGTYQYQQGDFVGHIFERIN